MDSDQVEGLWLFVVMDVTVWEVLVAEQVVGMMEVAD